MRAVTPRVSEGDVRLSDVCIIRVNECVFDLALQHLVREQQPSGSRSSEKLGRVTGVQRRPLGAHKYRSTRICKVSVLESVKAST
jgi:hypothetical protein